MADVNSYLSTPLNNTNGSQITTSDSISSNSQWRFEAYTGDDLDGVAASSISYDLICGETFDYDVYMYSSKIHINGPVRYSVSNTDGSATDKATIDPLTGELTALKSGQIRLEARYTDSPYCYWYWIVTIQESMEGTYWFKNAQYGNYMQIDNNASLYDDGAILELFDFDSDEDQRWNIEYVVNGYYKIVSDASGKAITAPSNLNNALTQSNYIGLTTQQWKIVSTGNGTYKISPRSSETNYMAAGDGIIFTNGRNVELRVDQSDNKDEWNLIRMLPLSGEEIEYDTSIWNYYPVDEGTNCYAYSLNNQVLPNTNTLWFMQPGQISGYAISSSNMLTRSILETYVKADSEVLGFKFEKIGKYDICSEGAYKVALVIAPNFDYHWYRQNSDGAWSHKRGQTNVVNTDADGNIIFDPETANRDYSASDSRANYSIFVGYYEVTPLNNFYVNVSAISANLVTYDRIDILADKSNLPLYRDIINIQKGMLYSEVTELIGQPQRIITSGLMIVEYDLSDGSKLEVEYVRNTDGYLEVEYAIIREK